MLPAIRYAASSLLLLTGFSAQAQVACGIIPKYLTNPPDSFISERGLKIGENKWKSNISLPGSACFIDYWPNSKAHESKCEFEYNNEVDSSVVYSKLTDDLEKCFSKFAEPWKKRVTNKQYDNGNATDTSWSKTMNDQTFRFTVTRRTYPGRNRYFNNIEVRFEEE